MGFGRQANALHDLNLAGIRAVAVDVADPAALAKAVTGLQPDILVNNAGMVPKLANFCDSDAADIDRAINLNVRSVIALTHLVAPGMRDRGKGHIFFTGSTAGHAPFPNFALYCATKAAVGGFAQALRLDLAPHAVRVTEIVAGRVETGLYRDILPQDARDAMYANQSAVQPRDVADMVMAVLNLPAHVDVSRFDILPTHQATPTGSKTKDR